MPRYRTFPYRSGSKGAKFLAEAMEGKVLRLSASKFRAKPDDVIVNWGNTRNTPPVGGNLLNPPEVVRNASNKLTFFGMMRVNGCENIIPPYWSHGNDIPDNAFPIVCRTVLAGHSGDGIVIADNRGELVPASLYVKYIKKQDEYRVHVGLRQRSIGEADEEELIIIAIQRKARRNGFENPNWKIRNLDNGFVYVRQAVNPPQSVLDVSKQALQASGLDFGAVDVIHNRRENRSYVLEINTAPGLEGTTVEDYAAFFKGVI